MENFEIYANFFHTSFPRYSENSEWFSKMSEIAFSKIGSVRGWWDKCSTEFCQMSGSSNSGGHFIFTYLKSCQFTEYFVTLKTQELSSENQELKSLIYGMLDEINELKEHNRSLSERIHLLETKPPILL